MNQKAATKNPLQLLFTSTPHCIVQETLRSTRHCTIEKGEHCNNTAHSTIDAIILDTKYFEHHTARVQAYDHCEEHSDVEHQRVLCYAFVIFGNGRHLQKQDIFTIVLLHLKEF